MKFWNRKERVTQADVMKAYDTGTGVGEKAGYMRGFNIGYDAGYENGVQEGHRGMDELTATSEATAEALDAANARLEQVEAENRALRAQRDTARREIADIRHFATDERVALLDQIEDLYADLDAANAHLDERNEELAVLRMEALDSAAEATELSYDEGYHDGVEDATVGIRYTADTPNDAALSAQYWQGYHQGYLNGTGKEVASFDVVSEVTFEDAPGTEVTP